MTDEHDHSGDELGVDGPVASINVETVTVREFATPDTYVVARDGDSWYGLRTADQDVVFRDSDGVVVINEALRRLDQQASGDGATGTVLVSADPGGTLLESKTPISHTTDGAALVLEHGVTFEYTGTDQAVVLAGDNLSLEFDTILASNAEFGLVDRGLANASVRGHSVGGAREALWFADVANWTRAATTMAGVHVNVNRFDCTSGTRQGIALGSAPGVAVSGYVWRGVVVQPKAVGVQIGDRSGADSVHNQLFYVSVRGAGNDATHLVEFNDSRNGVFLESYTPATGGDWDVVLGETAHDTFLLPMTGRGRLRVKREAQVAADFSKFDTARHEVLPLAFRPESLAGYQRREQGSGTVSLEAGGAVHDTGALSGSEASLRKRMAFNFGRLRFDNPAALQTHVQVADNAGQEAWLLWGHRDGPAVGWHIVDDRLEGFVHRGHGNATTVALRTGFDPGAGWNLTAFYNPPTDVQFYVDGAKAGEIDKHLPSGFTNAHRVLTVDLTNTEAASKALRWSTWRNHQYPREDAIAPAPPPELTVSGSRQDDGDLFTGGETNEIDLTVAANKDVDVRDVMPAEWTVRSGDSPDVARTETVGDRTYVYFDETAPAETTTGYTYVVEAPTDTTLTGTYTFGPVQVQPLDPSYEQYEGAWFSVSRTTDADNAVVAA